MQNGVKKNPNAKFNGCLHTNTDDKDCDAYGGEGYVGVNPDPMSCNCQVLKGYAIYLYGGFGFCESERPHQIFEQMNLADFRVNVVFLVFPKFCEFSLINNKTNFLNTSDIT